MDSIDKNLLKIGAKYGACYIRVSTDDQTEYSPDAQLKAIKEYARKNELIILSEHIYVDEGVSGKRADKRPQFMKMIATAKSKPKPFDVILVHKFDRFARSREDSIVYKSLLRRDCGIKVISITESIEDDKFSIILEAMLEAMAEYYSLNLAEEVKKGMTEKAERGEIQTKASFGYRMENKKLIVVPEEAKLVKFIFQQFATRKMKMRQLAVYLNDLGIRTKQGNTFENRNIDYILNNPVYIGKSRWTPTGRVRRDFNNPDSIVADANHEPIIDMMTWQTVQEIIKENKELYPRPTNPTAKIHSWINGLVVCGNCSHSLVNSQNKYLQCNGYSKGKCKTSCNVKYSIIEDVVLEEIKRTFQGKIEINVVPRKTEETTSNEYEFLRGNLDRLRGRLERIKESYQNGIDSLAEYKESKEMIEAEQNMTLQRLQDLKQTLLNPPEGKALVKEIESAYELLRSADVPLELKYKTAHFLINKIVYTKQEQVIRLEYK